MPSSPGYRRDLKEEYKDQKARGDVGGSDSPNSQRKRARRKALKMGMVKKGQDLDHKKPISKGGGNAVSNLRATSPSENRSFPRKSDGSIK